MLLLVGLQRSLGKLDTLAPGTLRRGALCPNRVEIATCRYGLWIGHGITSR